MKTRLPSYISIVLVLAALVSGCVISPRRNQVNHGATGQLYVATASGILRFSGATQVAGNVAPAVTISGTQSQLSAPQRLHLDVSHNRLLVANQGGPSILIFTNVSSAASNASPTTVLTSPGNLSAPVDVAIDPTTGIDLLYVADGTNVLVFGNQSGLTGNANPNPVRTINFGFSISAILLDASTDRLFAADPSGNQIVILPKASTANGATSLLGVSTLSGTNTLLAHPNGLVLDNTNQLIVSNLAGPSITVYASSDIPTSGNTNNATPVANIVGSNTGLSGPGQLVFNGSAGTSGELYVADSLAASILTYLNAASFTKSDNLAPHFTFSGSKTGLATINGIALDATR